MKRKILTIIVLVLTLNCALILAACGEKDNVPDAALDNAPDTTNIRKYILDTDWLADVDDAVAVRYLLRKHFSGEAEVLGINVNATIATSGPSLDSFAYSEGLRLPIAMDKQATGYRKWSSYHKVALKRGGGARYGTSDDYPDSVEFYRKILASIPEGEKIDIISVGFMNSLARLLESAPDDISPLSGEALVSAKVSTLWAMAGKYPDGKEYNISCKPLSVTSAQKVCNSWPTEIVFLGYECGNRVKTGGTLRKQLGKDDLLYRCLLAQGTPLGRSSWDPMTVYLAIVGNPSEAGFGAVRGTNAVSDNGKNSFTESADGKHYYVKLSNDYKFYRDKINKVIAAKV